MKNLVLLVLIAMSLIVVGCSDDSDSGGGAAIPAPVAGAEGNGWSEFPAFTYDVEIVMREWSPTTMTGELSTIDDKPAYSFYYSGTQYRSEYKADLKAAGFNLAEFEDSYPAYELYVKRVNGTDYVVKLENNQSSSVGYQVQIIVWATDENVAVSPRSMVYSTPTDFSFTFPSSCEPATANILGVGVGAIYDAAPQKDMKGISFQDKGEVYIVVTCNNERRYSFPIEQLNP